jgi:hypothetical protein
MLVVWRRLKPVLSFRYVEQRTHSLKSFERGNNLAVSPMLDVRSWQLKFLSIQRMRVQDQPCGEVVMRIEVDEQQAGFRILRRAAHARF